MTLHEHIMHDSFFSHFILQYANTMFADMIKLSNFTNFHMELPPQPVTLGSAAVL